MKNRRWEEVTYINGTVAQLFSDNRIYLIVCFLCEQMRLVEKIVRIPQSMNLAPWRQFTRNGKKCRNNEFEGLFFCSLQSIGGIRWSLYHLLWFHQKETRSHGYEIQRIKLKSTLKYIFVCQICSEKISNTNIDEQKYDDFLVFKEIIVIVFLSVSLFKKLMLPKTGKSRRIKYLVLSYSYNSEEAKNIYFLYLVLQVGTAVDYVLSGWEVFCAT